MAKALDREPNMALYEYILQLKDLDECYRFFQDLCSMTELRSLEQRFHVALLLNDGKVYTDIMNKTGASTATISRVNRTLHYGHNGFLDVLSRMDSKSEENKND